MGSRYGFIIAVIVGVEYISPSLPKNKPTLSQVCIIVHFIVVWLVTLALSGSEAGGDLALIQTFLVFMLILLFSC